MDRVWRVLLMTHKVGLWCHGVPEKFFPIFWWSFHTFLMQGFEKYDFLRAGCPILQVQKAQKNIKIFNFLHIFAIFASNRCEWKTLSNVVKTFFQVHIPSKIILPCTEAKTCKSYEWKKEQDETKIWTNLSGNVCIGYTMHGQAKSVATEFEKGILPTQYKCKKPCEGKTPCIR